MRKMPLVMGTGLAVAALAGGFVWYRHTRSATNTPPSDPHSTADDPPGTLAFAGRVVDEAGQAVAGATVTLSARPVLVTTSGADGAYRFEHLLSRPYNVEATLGDRYADRVPVRVTASVRPVELRLRTGATLAVHVVDEGGVAVANAAVVVDPWPPPDANLVYIGTYHNGPHRTTTDAHGDAVVLGVSHHWHALHVEATDHDLPMADHEVDIGSAARATEEVTLKRGASDDRWTGVRPPVDDRDPAVETDPSVMTVDGTVVDAAGERVPFAEVSLGDLQAPNFVTADAHGDFRVRSRFFQAMLQVVARDAERSSQLVNPGWVERKDDDRHVTVRLVLADGMVDGVVVDAGGAPIAGAAVEAGGLVIPLVGGTATTDTSGRFRIGPLPQDGVEIRASLAGTDRRGSAPARPGDHAVRVTL
jgi:hypothetical protein